MDIEKAGEFRGTLRCRKAQISYSQQLERLACRKKQQSHNNGR
jgi:hypothetical protein